MAQMIYLDMDGTIADFYNVKDWLKNIVEENTFPYDEAKEIFSEKDLQKIINMGFQLGIISWLPKNGSPHYCKAVRQAKKEWLKSHYPNINFVEVHIVKYGTPKYKVAKISGLLVDDEEQNRKSWKFGAITPEDLRQYIEK